MKSNLLMSMPILATAASAFSCQPRASLSVHPGIWNGPKALHVQGSTKAACISFVSPLLSMLDSHWGLMLPQ